VLELVENNKVCRSRPLVFRSFSQDCAGSFHLAGILNLEAMSALAKSINQSECLH